MPIYDIKQLRKIIKEGDIILSRGEDFIGWAIRMFTQSYWNHASMYVGNGKVIEANILKVEITPLGKYTNKDIYLYRHRDLKDIDRKIIVNEVLQHHGTIYDHKQILQFAWYFITNQRKKGMRKMIGDKNKFVCSELVAKPYYEIGLPVLDGLEYWEITPADIDLSPYFHRVKEGIIFRKNDL